VDARVTIGAHLRLHQGRLSGQRDVRCLLLDSLEPTAKHRGTTRSGATPLYHACCLGPAAMVELRSPAEPNPKTPGPSPVRAGPHPPRPPRPPRLEGALKKWLPESARLLQKKLVALFKLKTSSTMKVHTLPKPSLRYLCLCVSAVKKTA